MSDISKLTVAQLKALCKEKGLKNYSKLAKPALLEKLAAVGLSTRDTNFSASKPKSSYVPNAQQKHKSAAINPTISFPQRNSHYAVPPVAESASTDPQERSTSDPVPQIQKKTAEVVLPLSPSEISVETIVVPISSGSKRSADTAFPNSLAQKSSKVSKTQTSANHISVSGTNNGFKIPEASLREVQIPFPNAVCAGHETHNTKGSIRHSVDHSNVPKSDQPSIRSLDQSDTTGRMPLIKPPPLQDNSVVRNQLQQNCQIRNGSFCTNVMPTVPLSAVAPSLSTPFTAHRSQMPPRPQKPKFVPPRATANVKTGMFNKIPLLSCQQPSAASMTSIFQPLEMDVLDNLKNISIPPSMTERKLLPRISIALSGLEDAERANCILVSKLFRYAVYISAQDILRHKFAGKRLSHMITNLSLRGLALNMTNLWPYLRFREREVLNRKNEYENSWVPRFLRDLGDDHPNPICAKLWTSPDYEEQFSVTFRFVQTRICFALAHRALGNVALNWVTAAVIDAQPVLEDEVWSITVVHRERGYEGPRPDETFYVLYQTCEVIGHPPPSMQVALSSGHLSSCGSHRVGMSHIHLRADWSSYIAVRLSTATRHLYGPLFDHILCTNTDDFENGVARAWLNRMEGQGEDGVMKKRLAQKYILGCVLGNSVSGTYKSATQMTLEFAGVAETTSEARLHRKDFIVPKLNMVVPERHNVESVYFTKPGGLHPALALVQTVGRQDGTLVLKENGIVVGEDETVPEVWMRLLGCNEAGLAK